MYADYKDRAHFYVIYIREAHPDEDYAREFKHVSDPKTTEERQKVAREFVEHVKLSIPVLVDTLDDQVSRAYRARPDRLYIIDAEGTIAYKAARGPWGFSPAVSVAPFVLYQLTAPPRIDADHPVARMKPNSWLAIPNTKLRQLAPDPEKYPNIHAHKFWHIIAGWNGGALDTRRNRLLIWGGGHNGYWGNELYAFDIDRLRWERLTEPCPNPNTNYTDPNPDGTPNSRHTYNGLAYLEHADKLFACGGSLTRPVGACGAEITWIFDFDAGKWVNKNPEGERPPTGCENNACYDPATRKVWFGDKRGLYAYDCEKNRWSQHTTGRYDWATTALDTKRGLLFFAEARGRDQAARFFTIDLRSGRFERQEFAAPADYVKAVHNRRPGLAYDPVRDRIVMWEQGPVYVLDPQSRKWTSYHPPGAPDSSKEAGQGKGTSGGTYGRWRYVPACDAFILVTGVDVDVHFYKMPKELP